MAKTTTDQSKPYIDNYPPLRDWLRKHKAFCQWQLPLGDKKRPSAYIECWQFAKRQALITVFSDQRGWEVYTPGASQGVAETFEDADRRLGQ